MSLAAWHLEQHRAGVQLDRLTASIDLTRPDHGLVDFSVAGSRLADARILGLAIPSLKAGRAALPTEAYVRGIDLVAVYEESESWPVRLDALWRATPPEEPGGLIAAVDLVLSVRTSLLESRPELAVSSTMPVGQLLRLSGAGPSDHDTLTVPPDLPLAVEPAEGPGCLVFRLGHGDLSYAEMVHPADFRHAALGRAGHQGELVRVVHRLFQQPLEKGVILRARLRGVWLPRRDDVRLAAQQYEAFAAAEPPLGA